MSIQIDLSTMHQETLAELRAAELRAAELRGRLRLLEELIQRSQAARSEGEIENEGQEP